MPAASKRGATTAGKHIQQHHPLSKGEACVSCKARKVRCDAGTPACGSCKRTARFEGRDPELVICQYNGKRCGVKASASGGKGGKGKGKASSIRSTRTESPEIQRSEETELDRILAANLKVLLPSLSSSSSSSSSSFASSSRTSLDSIFSRDSSTSSTSTSTSTCPLSPPLQAYPLWPTLPLAQTCDYPLEANFDWTQPLQTFHSSLYAYSYPTDPSAPSFLASYPSYSNPTPAYPPLFYPSSPTDSLSDEQILCPPSPPFQPYEDLPVAFSNSARDGTLSLPLFPLYLPPPMEERSWGGWEAGEQWGTAM